MLKGMTFGIIVGIILSLFTSCARDSKLDLGLTGMMGPAGAAGEPGKDSRSAGLSCAVHDMQPNSSTHLPEAYVGNPIVGTFTMANLAVPDSPSDQGFPGMPKELQDIVGLTDYSLDCSGYVYTDTSGDYTFKMLSDDGSELRINDQVIISNQGLHAPQEVTSQVVRLNRGLNRINVTYFQGPAVQVALTLKASGPNQPESIVPASSLTH